MRSDEAEKSGTSKENGSRFLEYTVKRGRSGCCASAWLRIGIVSGSFEELECRRRASCAFVFKENVASPFFLQVGRPRSHSVSTLDTHNQVTWCTIRLLNSNQVPTHGVARCPIKVACELNSGTDGRLTKYGDEPEAFSPREKDVNKVHDPGPPPPRGGFWLAQSRIDAAFDAVSMHANMR
ncbi:uncharacterized protein MEPE_01864 [Melanopsichium pennsylvanicum]|uniref:Uncharacterized protein n=1 Tax=Melanopsichium pennsylvanicum TaxID=63383 RepID=A0AAJ5C436_9BASI|nr:uncharacterized protein MEPE_01864 [Melanopsichium pennsylvanicum]